MELLPWDTQFFDVNIARARVRSVDALDSAISAAREADIDCLYVVVPQADAPVLRAAIWAGGLLTALRLTLEHRAYRPAAQPSSVRRATSTDAARVVELSAALASLSRFTHDPRFPRERIDEMYRIWALNDLHEGDVFVDVSGDCGLLTVSDHGDALAIGLVYVADSARGTGLGRALLDAAVARAGDRTLTVATDVRNVPALRLYESAEFRTRSVEAILHLWLERPG